MRFVPAPFQSEPAIDAKIDLQWIETTGRDLVPVKV